MDEDTLDCSTLDAVGDASTPQAVFVVVSHVASLSGLQFGITYDRDVDVLAWNSCGGATAISEPGWPADSTATALAWGTPIFPSSTDSTVVAGYFIVAAGSSDRIRLTIDARIAAAQYVDAAAVTHDLVPLALGFVDVDGGMGYVPRGKIRALPGGGGGAESGVIVRGSESAGAGDSWLLIDSDLGDQAQLSVKCRLIDFDGVSVLGTTHSWRHLHYLAADGKEIGPAVTPLRQAQDREPNEEDLHAIERTEGFHASTFRETPSSDTDMGLSRISALSHLVWEDHYDAWKAGDIVQPTNPDDRAGAVAYRPDASPRVYVVGTPMCTSRAGGSFSSPTTPCRGPTAGFRESTSPGSCKWESHTGRGRHSSTTLARSSCWAPATRPGTACVWLGS